ncbi:uncharacterized protein LOC129570108 [Sitodiplosis mosellana]|uniref:uncharacterized protein LOC129570108 n=1 Tax=Sitodiplosis mosellana TaxID=263140 RepID=UPI0024442BA5|nr:uncharacterized protein LOC129570108 [Sitodiplosis mosellana]
MEKPNINSNEYKFDPAPYTIAIKTFSEQIQTNCLETNPKPTFKQFDEVIGDKIEMCSRIAEEINKVRVDNSKMQIELKSLKKEEEHLSYTHLDLKEVLKNTCKVTFVQNNEDFRTLTQKIQMSLGFKLKLLQCQDSQHLWIATFLFDVPRELEGNYSVVILYNTQDESFTLRDLKPKHCRFAELSNFLANTNDITGLLYNCWKYFSSTTAQN